ncbi:hypothetical protein JHK82_014540 [Glycine max]|uniref:RING-CH-type domain-containing protein n=1 Tax=Glycine soja TaxID=3848 RepID=A0A445K5S4_GLYSO|nr:hypothetical protein JHK85_014911 [Glycine max]KAG5045156.1 hypothetical protein JHK86_014562 [Glycine max]KAG5147659.1 hypothetical protein JHK82_014540 [Glycine max]RZC06097.1 hypothetical protein D0Y65_013921 [Glycine soja]
MDQHRGEVLDPVHDRNLSHSVEGVAIARASISGEVGEVDEDLGSDKELKDDVKGQDKHDQENISDKLPGVDQGTSYNSNNLVNQEVIETVVVIESVQTEYANEDNTKLEAKVDESGLSLVSMKAPKGVSETDKNSCVIDIKCSSRKKIYKSSEGERICRICHLTSGQSSDATTVGTSDSATSADLIQLGCACKGKPGIAHVHCALAWFKLKGNICLKKCLGEDSFGYDVSMFRLCEICGEAAKNVSGVTINGFMEEWNERRLMDTEGNASHRVVGCW